MWTEVLVKVEEVIIGREWERAVVSPAAELAVVDARDECVPAIACTERRPDSALHQAAGGIVVHTGGAR
jgi:hypothetical protein